MADAPPAPAAPPDPPAESLPFVAVVLFHAQPYTSDAYRALADFVKVVTDRDGHHAVNGPTALHELLTDETWHGIELCISVFPEKELVDLERTLAARGLAALREPPFGYTPVGRAAYEYNVGAALARHSRLARAGVGRRGLRTIGPVPGQELDPCVASAPPGQELSPGGGPGAAQT